MHENHRWLSWQNGGFYVANSATTNVISVYGGLNGLPGKFRPQGLIRLSKIENPGPGKNDASYYQKADNTLKQGTASYF